MKKIFLASMVIASFVTIPMDKAFSGCTKDGKEIEVKGEHKEDIQANCEKAGGTFTETTEATHNNDQAEAPKAHKEEAPAPSAPTSGSGGGW